MVAWVMIVALTLFAMLAEACRSVRMLVAKPTTRIVAMTRMAKVRTKAIPRSSP